MGILEGAVSWAMARTRLTGRSTAPHTRGGQEAQTGREERRGPLEPRKVEAWLSRHLSATQTHKCPTRPGSPDP